MPPRPNTATFAPGQTLAVLMTAPTPVVTPQNGPQRRPLSPVRAEDLDFNRASCKQDVDLGASDVARKCQTQNGWLEPVLHCTQPGACRRARDCQDGQKRGRLQ